MLHNDQEGRDGVGGREALEGGESCAHIAGSLHCAAGINTTLQNSYTLIKNFGLPW